jgi:hypothetical protein
MLGAGGNIAFASSADNHSAEHAEHVSHASEKDSAQPHHHSSDNSFNCHSINKLSKCGSCCLAITPLNLACQLNIIAKILPTFNSSIDLWTMPQTLYRPPKVS